VRWTQTVSRQPVPPTSTARYPQKARFPFETAVVHISRSAFATITPEVLTLVDRPNASISTTLTTRSSTFSAYVT